MLAVWLREGKTCIFGPFPVYYYNTRRCDGMADVTDSKSVPSDGVWVRVPPPAPTLSPQEKALFLSTDHISREVYIVNERMYAHYLSTGIYTNPSLYADYFRALPDSIPDLGKLICDQIVHPTVLLFPNPNLEKYFGSFSKYPDTRVINEDEIFVTASAMAAELFRLDPSGFVSGKDACSRIAVTCRHASVLMASVCKAKGIPCRCRAGFIDFRHNGSTCGDHWINQIWNEQEHRWINVDVSGYYEYEDRFGFSQYDMPDDKFSFAAQAWLDIRNGKVKGEHYVYQDAKETNGLDAALIYLFLDFHSLMNNEIFYSFRPKHVYRGIGQIAEEELREIDCLAEILAEPDDNFDKLLDIWNTQKRFRILTSPFNEDF